ncbi:MULTISPECIES: hypothetical protein [Bacteria]|uniref:hypothetical protein n=1 Tax=Bacteria TaxID=2 RepID=UPI002079CBE3|nr:hypothetical protein [Cytobacillus oceanisediminis]USK44884.1 hypothetical protein LIT27_03140 [Cytobacillus oceanisediminis]
MVKRMPFERPAEHYDERLLSIDEQICTLLKRRKELSDNPGYPHLDVISKWAKVNGLYEDYLRSLFGLLENDEHFRPQVEPVNFQKYIPILKSVEKEKAIYSVNFIRQYENASVVNFNIDWEPDEENRRDRLHRHSFWELEIGEGYDTRITGGSGTDGHLNHNFVVSPSLPEQISGLEFFFKEYKTPFKKKPTDLEIWMRL